MLLSLKFYFGTFEKSISNKIMTDIIFDNGLLDAVRGGNAVLFLGAGASLGASSDTGAKIPDADELKKLIASKFLESDYENADFKTVYDFSASNKSVRELQEFLHETLSSYQPAEFHKLIPKFVWAGLATTNYDLIVERAYGTDTSPLQNLLPNCCDSSEQSLPPSEGKLLYVKLHGCITHYQITQPPLVGSTEQIIHHKDGRSGQFAQFLEWAKTKTLIFVGYGLGDANLRTLFDEIVNEGDNRPRHYIVRPNIKVVEEQYWSDRRVKTFSMSFQEFLEKLDREIPQENRKLALHSNAHETTTLTRFISVSNRVESRFLKDFCANHSEHVSNETSSGGGSPNKFYQGFDLGWYPIEESLDIARRINSNVIKDQIVPTNSIMRPQFAVIKAHAGAGKSVTLRRIAWETAKTHGRLVFYTKSPAGLSLDAFEELNSLTNQTIYLFVDDLADVVIETEKLLVQANKKSWPLVIVAGARVNEWNTRCESLHALVDEEYVMKYLSSNEIDELLAKLEASNCLGFLASLTIEQRKKKLEFIYGRQLLVALHEATKNKSFRDIIRDEYYDVPTPEAQILYLDVCSLHRLGPPVRAGLIGRVHGIRFEDFQEKFLLPLEEVVDVERDSSIGDWVYKARHKYIAQIIYEEVLKTVEEKFDNIMRIIGKLNSIYSYDREVIREIVKATNLVKDFNDRKYGDAIYEMAITSFGQESYLLHQRGIYEMHVAKDPQTLDIADRLFRQCLEQQPNNHSVKHSMAELALRRADAADNPQDRLMWRGNADSIAESLTNNSTSSYPYHTLAKSAVSAVKDALNKAENTDDELSHEAFSQAVKIAEERLRNGLQRFPNEPYLLTEEATLSGILKKADRSLNALEKAFEKNTKSELVTRRLARVLRAKGDHLKAIEVLRICLEHNPGSFPLHYDIAQAIRASRPEADISEGETLLYHFQRSFSKGDNNYEAQFWYARQLCLQGQQSLAKPIFDSLKRVRVAFKQKRAVKGMLINEEASPSTLHGVIYRTSQSYGFIRADFNSIEVYFEFSKEMELLEALQKDDRVSFNLGFTFAGPCAKNVEPV